MKGRMRNLRPFWRRGDGVGARGWQRGDGVGSSAVARAEDFGLVAGSIVAAPARKSGTYPPGVGYVPGRGPHGPSGHDGEYAGKCYCGYRPEECDAYAEALRLYGAPALEGQDQDKVARQRDALAVEVEQLKALLAEVEEQRDAMARDLIVLAHRRNDLRRLIGASPEQAHRNCLALSDRNAELRREVARLEDRGTEKDWTHYPAGAPR